MLKKLWADSLYRNSFWLMAGSFAMAGIGFFYWMIASKLYTPTQIGLATTFLSAAALINSFATLGFGTTLIRFLPNSLVKEKKINTAFTIISLAAFLIGIIYLIGLPLWTEKLLFIRSTIPALLIVIFFFPVNTINNITDAVFTAFREAHWVFVSNISQSIIKLVTLVIFSSFGVWGVMGSNMVAASIASILCLILIATRYHVQFRPTLDQAIIIRVKSFALGNYFSSLISTVPGMLLPIIITNQISPEQTAYFYIPNMIAGLLGVIPSTMARSYLTESSHTDGKISAKKPLLLTFLLLSPLVILIILFSSRVLTFFGKNYAEQGFAYLNLLALSSLLSVLNYFYGTKMQILKKVHIIFIANSIASTVYILFSLIFINKGILYVGMAANISHLSGFLVYILATIAINSPKINHFFSRQHNLV